LITSGYLKTGARFWPSVPIRAWPGKVAVAVPFLLNRYSDSDMVIHISLLNPKTLGGIFHSRLYLAEPLPYWPKIRLSKISGV